MNKRANRKLFRAAVLFLVFVVAAGAIGLLLNSGLCPREIRHVVLISIDTCRSDYLSCNGYDKTTTPNLDSLAGYGILFENAIAPSPITLPSHSSMLTGTIPPYHGVHDNYEYRLGPSNVTLAEILRERGWQTGAVVGSFVMDSQFGLDQGFGSYNDRFDEEVKVLGHSERRAEEVSRYANKWLQEHCREPFFLFLHYFDPHRPYDPPEPFRSRSVAYDARSLYAQEIAYTDFHIGEVITELKRLGIYDSTLIIITADHGEMLGEHGEPNHSYFIYQSAIKVPLIFKLPGQKRAQRIKDLVGIIDIVPTVCSLLGIEQPKHVHGEDLSCYLLEVKTPGREKQMYCESFGPTIYKANSLLGIVTNRFKYIQTTRPELYDLVKDPREINNLIKPQSKQANILQQQLKRILSQSVRKGPSDSDMELNEQTRRRLESLGYVSGQVEAKFDFDQSKDDPKDLINFHSDNAYAFELLFGKRYAEAEKLCKKMITERPEYEGGYRLLSGIAEKRKEVEKAIYYLLEAVKVSPQHFQVRNQLATILAKQGRKEEAIEHFTESLRIKPDQYPAYYGLGNVLLQQGKASDAVSYYRQALQYRPDDARTHNFLARALQAHGEVDEAISHFKQVLVLTPDFAGGHNELGEALILQRKVDEAISHFRQAVKLEADHYKAHYNLGNALTSQGKINEALTHFYRKVEIKPNSSTAHYFLGRALNKAGKTSEAIKQFEETLRLKPDWVTPMNSLSWLLATHNDNKFRNPERAITLAERACELTNYQKPRLIDTLAAAYAADGRFDDAIATAEKAVRLAVPGSSKQRLEEMKNRLKLYKAGQAYRDTHPIQDDNKNGKTKQ